MNYLAFQGQQHIFCYYFGKQDFYHNNFRSGSQLILMEKNDVNWEYFCKMMKLFNRIEYIALFILKCIQSQWQLQMLNQHNQGKYIKQLKLQGNKNYFPNKFYSPYDFMNKFNEAIEKRYDLKAVEVRYIISKSKYMKDIDDHYNTGINEIDKDFNNVFDIDDLQMKQILSDTILLLPPKDFDYEKLHEETQAAKKRDEEKKLQEIDASIQLLADLYAKKIENVELRSIDSFKMKLDPLFKDSQVQIFIKVVMNKAVEDKIETQKNSKNPIIIQSTGKQQIRIYLHPVKCDQESIDSLAKLSPITDWSLCSLLPQIEQKPSDGCTYWSMQEIGNRATGINQSIKIQNYIAIHKNKRGVNDSIEIYSFMFNQIVIKIVINLAQIKKIEYVNSQKKERSSIPGVRCSDYYLHLAYPPRYYISLLKPEYGSDDGYIKNWQRAENFMFIRNQTIMKDEFARLFLFNNTVVKIKVQDIEQEKNKFQNSRTILAKIINNFKGTIDCAVLQKNWNCGQRVSSLNPIFKYASFFKKFNYNPSQNFTEDKIWKLKYLLLVLIRFNSISPPEVQKILSHLQKNKDDLDIYIYIFWQSVSVLGTFNPELARESYQVYLQKQYNQIKKLSISDITNKISSNSQSISFVFRAFLTPSGYLYNPPTPQMKGRLLKEYCKHSEHFLRVTITDDNEGTLKNQKYITKVALKTKMKKIAIINREYMPLGWSPSQLRSYSLWYMHQFSANGERLKRQQVLSFLGAFDKITNPAKRAARIGQAFSASWTYLCKQNEIKEEIIDDDLSSKGYMYTDGIGKISANLIEKMSLKLHIRDLSILQIRYKGAKGILVKDNSLPKNRIVLRPSMIKYACTHQSAAKYLDILDWNKYKAGFLNRQTIILLKSLGIDDKVFEKRQIEHVQRISNLSFKDCSIFKHMNEELNTDISNLQPANVTILHLLRAGFKLEQQPFFRGVLETMKKNGYHQLKIKSNIMIKKSARIIGIIDQYDILEEGELYCSVFDNLTLNPKREHVEGDVIITRNPCLHPADIRKMICLSQAQVGSRFQAKGKENLFAEFVNCVIFPKKGQIPVTAQISGSDLDGDNFFISWDRELIPKQMQAVYLIDAPLDKKQTKIQAKLKDTEEQYEEKLNFFIEYLNYEKLGQIDNSHLVKADQSENYAKCKECIELAEIHGKAVDFPKTGYCPEVDPRLLVSSYPDFMEKQQSPQYYSNSILGKLYHDITDRIQNLLQECELKKSGKIDEQIIKQLLAQENQKKKIMFDHDQIKETLQIILNYQRQLSGLITLVGVDTQYEIYSGNFTIAKEKVKAFGKNRLIATILALRARYFQLFFASLPPQDRVAYEQAKENDLEDPEYFTPYSRRRTLLYYLCSYIIKFHKDQSFLNDETFGLLRKTIISIFNELSYNQEGKFCGFVWFVVPKILINQKYRVRRNYITQEKIKHDQTMQVIEKLGQEPQEEEVI